MSESSIDITAGPGQDVHLTLNITIRFTPAEPSGEPAVQRPPGPDDLPPAVAAALARLARTGSQHVREVADGLIGLGYVHAPSVTRDPGSPPATYLRILDPASPAHGVAYLNPQTLSFSRRTDRDRLSREPDARVLSTEVAFSHMEGATRALDIARKLKG
jgi:hypothetical protein